MKPYSYKFSVRSKLFKDFEDLTHSTDFDNEKKIEENVILSLNQTSNLNSPRDVDKIIAYNAIFSKKTETYEEDGIVFVRFVDSKITYYLFFFHLFFFFFFVATYFYPKFFIFVFNSFFTLNFFFNYSYDFEDFFKLFF